MTEDSTVQRRWRVPTWLRILVSIALLTFVASQIDLYEAMAVILRADIGLLLVVIGLVILLTFYAAYRWYILIIGHKVVDYWTLLRLTFLSLVTALVVPGGFVGVEAVKIIGLTRSTSDLMRSVASTAVDRILGVLSLLILALFGLLLSPMQLSPTIAPIVWICLVVIGVSVWAALSPTARRLVELCIPKRLRPSIVHRLDKCYVVIDEYRDRPWLLLWAGALAMVYQIVRALLLTVLAWALRIDIDFSYMIFVTPIFLLISLLPISISGHGVREVTLVYFLTKVGVPAEAAFSFSVLSYVIYAITILPIALVWSAIVNRRRDALSV